jgi:hydrogenase maturation protein HypF
MVRANIIVTGIVQGVGFRPFIYRKATLLDMKGYVLNLGDAGVRIIVEGEKKKIDQLIEEVRNQPPSISRVDTISVEWKTPTEEYNSFTISKSSPTRRKNSITEIPPDISICSDCVKDIFSPDSRWHSYPFTSCAACGPRLSTIMNLPYDRPNTTMVDFPLCNNCNTGYTNPLDRRYHAQTTACPECGPRYTLFEKSGEMIDTKDAIEYSSKLLIEGAILAIQGLSGTHLATITSNPNPIVNLRKRKERENRPFAVMVESLSSMKLFSNPTKQEIALLESWRRPIVLVKKRINTSVNFEHNLVAPGLDTIGVMLPYSGIHHLLFRNLDELALVMTSANPTGVPMYVNPDSIRSNLRSIADYFLVHNRRIHQRADDSVLKFVNSRNPVFLRRARGYAPNPLKTNILDNERVILGLGAEEKVCGAVLNSNYVYPTQHIGDINRQETADLLFETCMHYMTLLGLDKLDAIACDLHPEFITTDLAGKISEQRNVPVVNVQHHHAHLASLIGEHNIEDNTNIICITVDGFGYGDDGTAWGGEILEGNLEEYSRIGGLSSIKLPGGDLSAKYAARSLFGILQSEMSIGELSNLIGDVHIAPNIYANPENLLLLAKAIDKEINVVESSSAGRFLDAVSLLLGIASENSYDGECPMKLESVSKETDIRVPIDYISKNDHELVNTTHFLKSLIDLKLKGVPTKNIAYVAQWQLGSALANIACKSAEERGIDYIGFSGGVALNRIVTAAVTETIEKNDLISLIHRDVPPGDGGISVGQVLVASKKVV